MGILEKISEIEAEVNEVIDRDNQSVLMNAHLQRIQNNEKTGGKERLSHSTQYRNLLPVTFFLLILARSSYDHYARECNFGILKKKQKQNKKNIFRLCFN